MRSIILFTILVSIAPWPQPALAEDEVAFVTMRFRFPKEWRSEETVVMVAGESVDQAEGVVGPRLIADCKGFFSSVRMFDGVILRGRRSGHRLMLHIDRIITAGAGNSTPLSGEICVPSRPEQVITMSTDIEIEIPEVIPNTPMSHPVSTHVDLPHGYTLDYQIAKIRLPSLRQ